MPEPSVELIREATQEIGRFLSVPPSGAPDSQTGPAELARLGDLLGAVGRLAGGTPPQLRQPEMSAEIALYRQRLEQLLPALEDYQLRLLARRAQLTAQRSRLAAVGAWAKAFRSTI